ncbi:sigma-54 interaction domain-containing protein [Clostridium sp. UBA1652]|uniref:sigma-54 interaction domain-containing protein n=1 Tax=Clostridium sp. UBA1652 TaxID=1946348 RepID=UPI00257DF610|nr:sigma 54-interacting transcriptional regulator [Clostridium sp. UBA1652]
MNENLITIQVDSETKKKYTDILNKSELSPKVLLDRMMETYNFRMDSDIDVLLVADTVYDGVYITDKDGIVIYINKGYTRIAGVEEHEIVGRNIQEIWEEKGFYSDAAFILLDDNKESTALQMIGSLDKKSMRLIKPQPISHIVRDKKKEISVITTIERNNKIVLMSGKPFFDEEGNIVRITILMRDITELMKLKENLDKAENEKKKYLNELKHIKKVQLEGNIISKSKEMDSIRSLIKSIAKTDATVLITGETGVGKEVVAKEIYVNSNRNKEPYVKINCAAIPETLLESELFGYEKGAFTGAQNKNKLGLFEIANNGTLLLDEIGEMPIALQSKLLRVLQDREIKRIGGVEFIKIDVRVIAATNEDLHKQIKEGKFREDLFYRLNVIPISIQPLRERPEDIDALADSFLEKSNKKYGKNKVFKNEALQALENYNWPGNVRELQNIIERLVIIGEEKLIDKDKIYGALGREKVSNCFNMDEFTSLKKSVEDLEREIIKKTLNKYGSTYKAAEILGITQSTVVRKAKSLGIKDW